MKHEHRSEFANWEPSDAAKKSFREFLSRCTVIQEHPFRVISCPACPVGTIYFSSSDGTDWAEILNLEEQ